LKEELMNYWTGPEVANEDSKRFGNKTVELGKEQNAINKTVYGDMVEEYGFDLHEGNE
jgi:hypothetical protein